jgi:hypothetical protein
MRPAEVSERPPSQRLRNHARGRGSSCPLGQVLAQSPGRVLLKPIPLGQPPSLHRLRGYLALFGGFLGTMGLSDFPRPFIIGVSLLGSRCGLRHVVPQTVVGSPGSRARCFRACAGSQGLRPRGVQTCLAISARPVSPSAFLHGVGTPECPPSRE